MTRSAPEFADLRQGDFVKARIGNERIWFSVLAHVGGQPSNAVICTLSNDPQECVFDGRTTLDRDWIIETMRDEKPTLKLVA